MAVLMLSQERTIRSLTSLLTLRGPNYSPNSPDGRHMSRESTDMWPRLQLDLTLPCTNCSYFFIY